MSCQARISQPEGGADGKKRLVKKVAFNLPAEPQVAARVADPFVTEAAAVDLRKPFRNVCFNRPQQQRTRQSKMVHQCADLAELKQQLDEAGDNLVVIDFFATWCGPCKMIAPYIEELSKTHENVVFLKIDVDEAEDAAQEYNVSAMPTFLFIKSNEKVAELMGANAEKLKELVEKHA